MSLSHRSARLPPGFDAESGGQQPNVVNKERKQPEGMEKTSVVILSKIAPLRFAASERTMYHLGFNKNLSIFGAGPVSPLATTAFRPSRRSRARVTIHYAEFLYGNVILREERKSECIIE